MARLRLRGIKKSFRATAVLHGIDLDIGDREFVVFVGPSGCGKSTLLRLIAGLDPITEGEFVLNDQRMNDVPPSKRGIAMVFQSYALYPHMDVYENMAFGARLMGLTKPEVEARIAEAARMLRLEPLLQRKPRELSGGQRAAARCVPARRTAQQSRRSPTLGSATGNRAAAPADRRHDDLCDA